MASISIWAGEQDKQIHKISGHAMSPPPLLNVLKRWHSNVLKAWLVPLLDPIQATGVILLLAPCLIQILKLQISSIANITASWVLVQYQTVAGIVADDIFPF